MIKTPRQWVVIGPGFWGRSLASILLSKGIRVEFLGEESTPENWTQAFSESSHALVATPFSAIHSTLESLKRFKLKGVVNASKGIDRKSLLTFSGLSRGILKCPTATLSGPTFSHEVLAQKPSACVVAGKNVKFVKETAALFSSDRFRCYTSNDPVGVEACGALKNVLAIAAGISDGLQLGQNARAALLTRGLREMSAVVKILGGKPESVYGLAGLGDLILTATGDSSRNRQLGLQIASGQDLGEILKHLHGPAEGYYTVEQVHRLAKKKKVDLPICEQILKVLQKKVSPEKAITTLMTRKLRGE